MSNDTAQVTPVTQCPVCHGAVHEVVKEHPDGQPLGITYEPTVTPYQIALALDNEAVARRVSALLTNELRLAIAGVLLEGEPGADGFFTIRDVEDEAEAGLRSLDVAKQLSMRGRSEEAAHFRGLSERHQKRAIRITALLSESAQQLIKQRVHGGPLGNQVPAHIRIVTS